MSGERGEMSLAQMLVSVGLFLGIVGATLGVFDSSARINRDVNDRNEAQDRARTALDRVAAQLRNLASPTPDQPLAIDTAGPYDLVFRTVDRIGPNSGQNLGNVQRVRYCLGTADASRLYRQDQRWTTSATPDAPDPGGCPAPLSATGWSTAVVAAESIANTAGGADRPIFVYDAAAPTDVSTVHVHLYTDIHPDRAPGETSLSTGVFLRNQNRRPTAGFTAEATASGQIILNGALSGDPEGQPLEYHWIADGVERGTGIRYDLAATPGTTYEIRLRVVDSAGLEGLSDIQEVTAR